MSQKVIPAGTPQHATLLAKVLARVQKGRHAVDERAVKWRENEEQFIAYMPAKEVDAQRAADRKVGKPGFTTIEIPVSYAIALTAHTYITSTFLARNPVLQVQGRHGEGENAVMGMEALLDYQVQTGEHLVPMFVWTLDSIKYGTGWMGMFWDEEKIRSRRFVEEEVTFLGIPTGRKKKTEQVTDTYGYCGNRAYNIRPYDLYPDPSYPVNQFQKGEFVVRYTQMSRLDIGDAMVDKEYFNKEAFDKCSSSGTPRQQLQGSSQIIVPGDNRYSTFDRDEISMVNIHEVYIRLVPKDWGLGSSTRSEKWVFTVAEEAVIIGCRPLGYHHDKFPFAVLEGEIDGHSTFTRSLMEIMKPLNDTLTWLINTHFYNVRKNINDQFVVDPSKIVMKDMLSETPGRLIRLKPSAYGTDARLAVSQLAVSDVTRNNLTDAQLIMDMLQRVTGVNDSLMGMINSGRKTATEVRSSTTFGVNRLKTTTEYMSAMGFGPWAQMLIQSTQQMYDAEKKFRIVGDASKYMTEKFMNVSPDDIAGFYDFIPVDGTLPVDRFAQVQMWNQLLQGMGQMPQVMQQYDIGKIFAFVAQLGGLKNIQQFKVSVVPDAQMQAQAQAGNSVPMQADPSGLAQNGGVPQPPQIPGMGQTS